MFEIIKNYTISGFEHVIPMGFDHILFIISLFLLSPNLKNIIIQCSVFTLAHSITLIASALGFIIPDSNVIEPLIAASILFTSIENMVSNKLHQYRIAIIFIFGLIHGMGFANALSEIGLPESNYLCALLFFNIGVEFGQISVILFAYFAIYYWFGNKIWYQNIVVYPLSAIIACIALYWTVTRIA